MKTNYSRAAFACVKIFILSLFLFPTVSNAQSSIGLTYDNEVGCQVFGSDLVKRLMLSDIVDGFCLRVCQGSTVNYELYGNDLPSIDSVEWIVAGGNLLADNTVTATIEWGGLGYGTLQLNITFNDGSTLTKVVCIEKIITPKAIFDVYPYIGAGDITVCEGQPVTFTQNSNDNGGSDLVSWYWDFGDQSPVSAAENPTHIFKTHGDYEVTLTVTNSCNCQDRKTLKVHVIRPGITISCPSAACENTTSTYSVDPGDLNGCTDFSWFVEGGHIVNYSPDHTQVEVTWDNVPATGFGYVSFDARNCNVSCPVIVTVRIPVIQVHGVIVGEAIICEKSQYRYKLPQWPATLFNWTLNPGTTSSTMIQTDQRNEVIINAENAGVILLKCEYTNTLLGCSGQAFLEIKIQSSVTINGRTNVCEGATETYTLLNVLQNPVSADWTLEGPGTSQSGTGSTFTGHFDSIGTYIFNINSTSICSPEVFTVTVVPRPQLPDGIAGETLVCPSAPVYYSVLNPLPGFEYSWSEEGGTIQGSAVGETISVIFAPGQLTYSISVVAIQQDEPHCTSEPQTITINVINPIIEITSTDDEVCASSIGSYEVSYSAGDTYNWTIIPPDAGSVSTGNGTNAITVLWNNYSGTGQPQVKVEVYECGQPYVDTFDVDIILSPTIALSTPQLSVCKIEDFTVTITGTPALTTIDHLVWDFGDGTPPLVIYPDAFDNFPSTATHQYTAVDAADVQYDITVTVYGPNGCLTPAQATLEMNVMPTPVADITPKVNVIVCDPADIDITFTANVQVGVGDLDYIEWYHDGVLISGASTYSYTPPATSNGFGEYYAIVYNDNGCFAQTNSTYVIEYCNPIECFIPPGLGEIDAELTACMSGIASISFTTQPANSQWGVTNGGTVTTYSTTATSSNCNLQFSEPGVYMIFFSATYITDGQPCTVVRHFPLTVPYQADLKYTIDCKPDGTYDVDILDHSVKVGGTTISQYDYFVDGIWYNSVNADHYLVNLAPGITHNIGIRISGPESPFSCEKTIPLILPAFPDPSFTVATSACPGEPILFTPTVINPDFTYAWSFGDFSNNSVSSPIKVYDSGSYDVTLTVTNSIGCSKTSAVTQINVFGNDMQGTVDVTPSGTACGGESLTLFHTPIGTMNTTPYTFNWMVGTNVIASTSIPQYNPTTAGIYWLSIIDGNNCKFDIPAGTVVNFIEAPEAIIEGPASVCSGDDFVLDGYTGGSNVTYSWSDGSSVVGTDPTLTVTSSASGTYTYTLTVSIPNGAGFCSNSTSHSITILPTPPVPVIHVVGLNCDIYGVKLNADAGEPGFYSWSNGDSGQNITVYNGGPYQVRFTNLAGCTSTAQIDIPKAPSAYMWVFPQGCYNLCANENQGYVIGPIEPMREWQWLIDNTIVDSGISSYVDNLPVTVSGDYQLYLDTGLCGQLSEPMSITAAECAECHFKYSKIEVKLKHDVDGNCYYVISVQIYSWFAANTTISAPGVGGIFSPSTFYMNLGLQTFAFDYFPPPGFSGGVIPIVLQSIVEGKICTTKQDMTFPRCDVNSAKLASTEGMETTFIYAAPNPGREMTNIFFNFGNCDAENKTIEVYDLLGRPVIVYNVEELAGVEQLDIARFVDGYYLILMKADGKVISQAKLLKG